MNEDTTIIRQVEIVRFHGEGLEEVVATVPATTADEAFSAVTQRARKFDIPGRFTYRNAA